MGGKTKKGAVGLLVTVAWVVVIVAVIGSRKKPHEIEVVGQGMHSPGLRYVTLRFTNNTKEELEIWETNGYITTINT